VYAPRIDVDDAWGAAYDAMYLFGYAVAALGDAPPTGANLARALRRLLPPGDAVDVGPSAILAALKALRAGKNIDLAGAGTTLDYDLDTGDAPAEQSMRCVGSSKSGEPALVESELFYDPRTHRLSGGLNCP
jgi:hypothetical protein